MKKIYLFLNHQFNSSSYGSSNYANDIALLKVNPPLQLDGETVNMVCLPDQGQMPPTGSDQDRSRNNIRLTKNLKF